LLSDSLWSKIFCDLPTITYLPFRSKYSAHQLSQNGFDFCKLFLNVGQPSPMIFDVGLHLGVPTALILAAFLGKPAREMLEILVT
jgi:uncharacterized membrane protein SpoIIM required for sporulation